MLAVGIKNSIIFILIVFIINFIIKFMLLSQTNVVSTEYQQHFTEKVEDPAPNSSVAEKYVELQSNCQIAPQQNMANEKDQLLEFVFGKAQSTDSASELDAFFKDSSKSICDNGVEQPFKCHVKSDDHSIPLKTSCEPNINEIKPTCEKKPVPFCNTTKQLHIIKEYDNENQMNGGVLYDTISAFDMWNQEFSPL